MQGPEIKAQLVKKGISYAKIAAECGVSPGLITNVVAGRTHSRKVQEAIANHLSLPFHEVWGK